GLAWAVTQAARYDLDNVSRVASRLEGYSTALRAVARKPITGFGLGSAADAYDEEFVSLGLEHFTTHNMFLKLQIELGVVGVLLWLALLVPLAVRAVGASSDHDASPLAAVMLAALVLNGVVGSGLDAWPVSGLALFLAAAAVGSSQRPWT
ncbi:MAG TPA: O-antigen ligase family protein, partial [Actinomycetota bacterium]|nr:O-antigen ligase family protein [Actinomycetota bacterium]